MFRIALAIVALRILDDNFLQPAAGTSPADHLVSGLVPLALLGLAAYAYPRLAGFWQGTLSTAARRIGGIAVGIDAVYYTRELGLTADDITGFLAIGAGLALLGLGAVKLFTTRSHDGHRAWRYGRRTIMLAALYALAPATIMPVAIAYVTTHTARAVVPADELNTPHETITFKTKDGLKLEGWYIPSRNGAAVIAFPGRKGPQRQARMLAKHGYGVLLFDRRGEGRSEGEPNTFGWGGDEDVKAAVRYLHTRADVDPKRIGAIGLSVGGEMLLEAAAETKDIAAVVSDGAGARSMGEMLDTPGPQHVRDGDVRRQLWPQGRGDDGHHRPHAADAPGDARAEDRPAPAAADRRPRERERREAQPGLLQGRARAEGAVGDPARRPRQRHRAPTPPSTSVASSTSSTTAFNDKSARRTDVRRAPATRVV